VNNKIMCPNIQLTLNN